MQAQYSGSMRDDKGGYSAGHDPRILHQTFPTAALPEVLAEGVARPKAMNAGWDYRFYYDGQALAHIERKFGKRVLAPYRSINPADQYDPLLHGVGKLGVHELVCMQVWYRLGGLQ